MRQPARTALALCIAASSIFAAADSDFHIPFEKYTLKNGLRVVLSRDTAVPMIAVDVLYDVGARSEEKGRTGFAHLFERMMFAGSANVGKGEHAKYVQANGGETNGLAHPDYTEYFETMASNKLGLALWLESDRMRSLAITGENLKDQRDAVRQERRRLDNEAYNTAVAETWPTLVFGNFQNSHSRLGSLEDLDGASLDDFSKFFTTYYAPNNAVLAIAGDFETAETKRIIEQYFGGIPAQAQPARPDLTEPARAEGKAAITADPRARAPAIVVGWPAPARHSDEWYAIALLDSVLTDGESCRLRLDLVQGKQTLLEYQSGLGWPFAGLSDFKDPGEYAGLAVFKPNYRPQQIVDEIQQEIDQIATGGVDDRELARVKAVVRFGKISALQSSLSRARLLGQYELLDGKPEMADQDLTRLLNVTSAGIQEAAKKYLTAARRDVLVIRPTAPPPARPAAPPAESK